MLKKTFKNIPNLEYIFTVLNIHLNGSMLRSWTGTKMCHEHRALYLPVFMTGGIYFSPYSGLWNHIITITVISFTFIGYKSWIMKVYYGKTLILSNFNLLTLTCELSRYPWVCFGLSVDQVSMVEGSMFQQMPKLWVSSLSHHIADPPFKNLERKPTLMWCTPGAALKKSFCIVLT